MHILTSVWSAQHPNPVQNIQHLSIGVRSGYVSVCLSRFLFQFFLSLFVKVFALVFPVFADYSKHYLKLLLPPLPWGPIKVFLWCLYDVPKMGQMNLTSNTSIMT